MSRSRRIPASLIAFVLIATSLGLGACNALFDQTTGTVVGNDAGDGSASEHDVTTPSPEAGADAGANADAGADAGTDADADAGPAAIRYPAIESLEIVPVYYGTWDPVDVTSEQNLLRGLTQYLTGGNAAHATETMFVQYGVSSAILDDAVTIPAAASSGALDRAGVLQAIHAAQPQTAYAPNRLVLFLASSTSLLSGDCAYHGAEGQDRYFAVASRGCAALSMTRTILQAAVDPGGAVTLDQDDHGAPCNATLHMWFGDMPGLYDKSQSACSTTGWDATDEPLAPGRFTAVWSGSNEPQIQVNGVSFTDFTAKADALKPLGWRFVVAEPYIYADQVLYNGVWHPGTSDEVAFHKLTPADLQAKDDQLYPQGYRLKIVEPYVLADTLLYTAVWERGSEDETRLFDRPSDAFKATYTTLKQQGQRIKLLRAYELLGQTYYTAVLHPSTQDEQIFYAATGEEQRTHSQDLEAQGYRFQVFQSYVQQNQIAYTLVYQVVSSGDWDQYYWNSLAVDYRAGDDGQLKNGGRLRSLTAVPHEQ